ncbi:hypothetical protein ABMA28_014395 [Loxostege sticticalis]|uniref:Uncharacterized protein n=1 Tax=Loxostege sticticalis TaxID=481309 RepID=A0ABD0TGM3_LOXSC
MLGLKYASVLAVLLVLANEVNSSNPSTSSPSKLTAEPPTEAPKPPPARPAYGNAVVVPPNCPPNTQADINGVCREVFH